MVEATCRYIEVRLNLPESFIANFVTAKVLLYNAFDKPKKFLATFFFTHAKASIIYLLEYFSKPKLSQNHKLGHSSITQPFVTCPLAVDQRCYGAGGFDRRFIQTNEAKNTGNRMETTICPPVNHNNGTKAEVFSCLLNISLEVSTDVVCFQFNF